MDPFSGAMIGYKVGKFGAELWWGTHQDNINQAQGLVEDFENSGAVNYAYIKKAESLLEQVPSDEKDYIVAMQNYLLAICYYYEQMYHASLRCLNIVSDFKIGTFTACAETLADIQNEATYSTTAFQTSDVRFLVNTSVHSAGRTTGNEEPESFSLG